MKFHAVFAFVKYHFYDIQCPHAVHVRTWSKYSAYRLHCILTKNTLWQLSLYSQFSLADLFLQCQFVCHPLECLVVKTSKIIVITSVILHKQVLITMLWGHSPTSSVCYVLSQGFHSHLDQSTKQTGPSCIASFQPNRKHFSSCMFALEAMVSIDYLQFSRWKIQVEPQGEPLNNTCCLLINRQIVCSVIKD